MIKAVPKEFKIDVGFHVPFQLQNIATRSQDVVFLNNLSYIKKSNFRKVPLRLLSAGTQQDHATLSAVEQPGENDDIYPAKVNL